MSIIPGKKRIRMDNSLKTIVLILLGFIIGFLVYDWFFAPEFTVEYREKIVTDTTYKHYKEKYQVDSIKSKSLSDSIDFFKKKYKGILTKNNITIVHDSVFINKPFLAPLRRFNGQRAFLYGNTHFNAVVAGELLDMEISNDFRIPQITNTITKENRTIIKPSGLYGTLGFRMGDQQLSTLVGATYLKDRSLIFYNYDLKLQSHQAGVGFKILGR